MCGETTHVFRCDCQELHINICIGHIAHTHKQIDNEPCPDLKIASIEVDEYCNSFPCLKKTKTIYFIESTGHRCVDRDRKAERRLEQERLKTELGNKENVELGRPAKRQRALAAVNSDDEEPRYKAPVFNCPNISCAQPMPNDGYCRSCGTLVDVEDSEDEDSNAETIIEMRCPNPDCFGPSKSVIIDRYCMDCGTTAVGCEEDDTEEDEDSDEDRVPKIGCFNDNCENTKFFNGTCTACYADNQCINKECARPAVKSFHCLNCHTVQNQKFFNLTKNHPCHNIHCEPSRYDSKLGICLTCRSHTRCPNPHCLLPQVELGSCSNCDTVVPDSEYNESGEPRPGVERLRITDGIRSGRVAWTDCPSCDKPEVRNGICQNCKEGVPICVSDDCKSYNISSSNMCEECGYPAYGVTGKTIYDLCDCENSKKLVGICAICRRPKRLLKDQCVEHVVTYFDGVCQACGVVVEENAHDNNDELQVMNETVESSIEDDELSYDDCEPDFNGSAAEDGLIDDQARDVDMMDSIE